MKNYTVPAIFILNLVLLASCSRKAAANVEPESEVITIGICKIMSHPALDAIESNIVESIEKSGKNVEFDLQNANGEASAANSIAQLFQNKKVDLAIGIATPTTQALVQNLSGIPIFYSAITDPEGAGLFSKVGTAGMQITGYSDLTPIEDHIATIRRIQPDLQTLGQIYSSDEDNSRALNEMTAKVAEANGIQLISVAVTNTAEVRDATLSIIDKVDAFYVTVDNKVISALSAVGEVAHMNQIPLYTADPSSAPANKVALAMGFDYASMGKATGELVARYLEGDETVFDRNINYLGLEYQTLWLNQELLAELGLSVPEDISSLAQE